MNIKTILIGLFVLSFLFLLFLNSGGLYEYKSNSQGVPIFRVNKITNKNMTFQELLENISELKNGNKIDDIWYTIYEYYKNQNEWYKNK